MDFLSFSKKTKKLTLTALQATSRLHDSKRVIEELPDPRLEGNFEEEEMQVMAYLAKECLLLDPDSRPTMSEVVQVLSTIAPDRSKRNNMPIRAFQVRIHDIRTHTYHITRTDTLKCNLFFFMSFLLNLLVWDEE